MNCYWCGKPLEGLEFIQSRVKNKCEKFHYLCYGNKLQGAQKP